MTAVRFVAVLLAVALTGPFTSSLLCDWACAAKHQQTGGNPSSGCHEQSAPTSGAAIVAADRCHDLAEPDASIVAAPMQDAHLALLSDYPAYLELSRTQPNRRLLPRPDTSQGLLAPLIPLRI